MYPSDKRPRTYASGANKRRDKKQKLENAVAIKSYLGLRSSIAQDRLDSLALISIENEAARQLDLDTLVDKFANIKARKKEFWVLTEWLHTIAKDFNQTLHRPLRPAYLTSVAHVIIVISALLGTYSLL